MGYRFFCPEFHNAKVLVNLSEERGLWVTPIDNLKKQVTPKLIETDSSGSMPEVMKDLIERTFLRNAKPKFREVLFDVDDIVYSAIKPVKKNLRVWNLFHSSSKYFSLLAWFFHKILTGQEGCFFNHKISVLNSSFTTFQTLFRKISWNKSKFWFIKSIFFQLFIQKYWHSHTTFSIF